MRTMRWIDTRGFLSALTLTLIIAVAGLLYPVPAGAADTLDQSQTDSQSPAVVSAGTQQGQIFTAGTYGWLDRVSLRLEKLALNTPAGAVLTVSVQTVIGGLPSGLQIGSGRVELEPLGSADWVDVSIRGARMTAGTQYALVLQTSPWNADVRWWYAYNTSYAGGVTLFNDGTSWRVDDEYDFTFKTYVIPDVMDQSQTHVTKAGIINNQRAAQIFVAGLSGVIDRVRVFVSGPEYSSPDLGVTIQTVTGGYPSGIVIGQGLIPSSSVPCWQWSNGAWVTVAINNAVVTAGTQYALVLSAPTSFGWAYAMPDYTNYTAGIRVTRDAQGWKPAEDAYGDAPLYSVFETYVLEPLAFAPPPPPATITPCSSGVCPSAGGLVNPPDSPARVMSMVQFWEMPNGKIQGMLHFDDSRTGDLALKGCGTNSNACRLTVTQFACTDQHAITIAGTYTLKGEEPGEYLLTLSGIKKEVGTFTLTAGDYTFIVTHKGIVDVTCPPAAEIAGRR